MGKRLDALFRKPFSTSRFRNAATKVLARIATLRKEHQARWSQARADVVQLLDLDHHESTFLRVDHVIREQNLLDALVMIEGYCTLLVDRVALIKSSKDCPEELKEAISSVIFAASRCGQLPELHEICRIFTKKYGKELICNANELRNNCGVNPKIAEKLATRRISLRTRLKVLKQIAAGHRIALQLEGGNSEVTQEMNGREDGILSTYLKAKNRYKNVKQAAQAAYVFAAQAAAAAKVAAELSCSRSPDKWQEESGLHIDAFEPSFRNFNIQSPDKKFGGEKTEDGPSNSKAETQEAESVLPSESDSEDDRQVMLKISGQSKTPGSEIASDGKEDGDKRSRHKHGDSEKRFSWFTDEFLSFRNTDTGKDESNLNESTSGRGIYPTAKDGSSRGRRPISVRTRRIGDTPRRDKRPVYL